MEDEPSEGEGTVASDPQLQGFQIQFEKSLPNPARPGLAAWSPQHDLLCFVTTNENVLLYRMNGQRVWGIAPRKDKDGMESKMEQMQWRPDGKVIALGYSDGVTRICDVNNGKMVLTISPDSPEFGVVSCVGWVDNRMAPTPAPSHWRDPQLVPGEIIPRGVLDLEINQMLPRLSVLPAGAGPDSLFSSKITLDAMINTVKGTDGDILDVLLVGDINGRILVNIFESFVVGAMHLSSLCPQLGRQCQLIKHTSPPSLATHALLIKTPESLCISTLDLLFTQQFGQYLHQLAFTSTKVQALLKYVQETVIVLNLEWKTMNDLHSRYISLVDDALQEAGSPAGGVGLEFFELLVTGVGSAGLKEWLVDALTERGQKRWEKTSINGYEALRRLVHENVLPTCERLTILLSRLRGLARWKERGSPLGLEPEDFTRCIDAVSGLTVYAHLFLQKLNHELELFRAFSHWLKYVLDQLSSVININDTPPEDPQIDTLRVAEYVSTNLLFSSLVAFFAKPERPQGQKLFEDGESVSQYFYNNETYNKEGSCSWGDLTDYLMGLCYAVFEKPATAMRRSLRVSRLITLFNGPGGSVDNLEITMLDEPKGPVAYIAIYSKNAAPEALIVIKCQFCIEGGLSTVTEMKCIKLQLSSIYQSPEDGSPMDDVVTLLDVKFVDGYTIILLIKNEAAEKTTLLTTAYQILGFSSSPIPSRRDSSGFNEGISSVFDFAISNEIGYTIIEPIKARAWDWGEGFLPEKVFVNGNPKRRIGAVIDKEGIRYIIFDLDADEVVEEEDVQDEEYMEEGANEQEDIDLGDIEEEPGYVDEDESMEEESDMDISYTY